MVRLFLIRHGQTDWNVEGRWQGQADVPLNLNGLEQAEIMAQSAVRHSIATIYTSDLLRARQTAEALARHVGVPVIVEPRLREIDQGEWQGMLATDIETRYAQRFKDRREDPLGVSPPGGETVHQVRERVVAAVENIRTAHPEQSVALVSHGFAIAVIRTHYSGKPFTQVWQLVPKNSELIELEI